MKPTNTKTVTIGCWGIIFPCLLAACDPTGTTDETETDRAIGFSATTTETSSPRAITESTTEALTDFGVFASYTGSADWNSTTDTPNFMYNQLVSRADQSASWTYTPIKYWPNTPGEKLSFFAYAPHSGNTASCISLSGNTQAGYPSITYAVPTAENSQIDLLAAAPQMNKKKADGQKITFSMYHALTKVTIKAKNGESHTTKTITSLTISAPAGGTLTFHVPTSGEKPFTWSNISANTSTFTAAVTTSNPISIENSSKDLCTFYLLPIGKPASVSLTLGYTFSRPNSSDTDTTTATVTLTDAPEWTPGTSLTYTLSVSGKELTIESTDKSISWTDGGTTEGEIETTTP
jgi:hypothetical protein